MKFEKYIPVGLLIFLITFFIGYGTLQTKAQNTAAEVEEVKEEVEETDEKLTENEKIDLTQSILIEQISKTLEKLDKKLDKDIKEEK